MYAAQVRVDPVQERPVHPTGDQHLPVGRNGIARQPLGDLPLVVIVRGVAEETGPGASEGEAARRTDFGFPFD